DSAVVNKRAVEYLVKAGAFDRLTSSAGEDMLAGRAALLASLDTAVRYGASAREQRAHGQSSLFGDSVSATPDLEDPGEVDELALLRFEKEALGIYISAHPMASYPGLPEAASCQIAQVDDHYRELAQSEPGRVKVVLSGLIQNVVKRPTRKGSMMARFEQIGRAHV